MLWLVARHAAILVLTGAAIGVPAALALPKLVKTFLYGIGPQNITAIVLSLLEIAGWVGWVYVVFYRD